MVKLGLVRSAIVTNAAGIDGIPNRVVDGQDSPVKGEYRAGVGQVVLGILQVELGLVRAFRPAPVALAGTVPPVRAVTRFCASVNWAVSSATVAWAESASVRWIR